MERFERKERGYSRIFVGITIKGRGESYSGKQYNIKKVQWTLNLMNTF